MKKRIFALILAALICFSMAACDDLDDEEYEDYDEEEEDFWEDESSESQELIGSSGDSDESWAIYWYLCGSDLESENGFATDDLNEMMEVQLPENVNVVIQTGGAWTWMNDFVDDSLTERYLYSSEGLELIDQQPLANMGESQTLTDFLRFCSGNYPADKTMVIFWNHGGGSVAGAGYDENYGYDQLTLDEFYKGFYDAFPLSTENPPIDVIGFDTCLMATIDTAYTFSDIGRYLVASEEFEPGGGWLYSGFLQALADDPGMDGARLGQHICDTYYEDNDWFGMNDEVTLSVVDLSKIEPLLAAYENMGIEALSYAIEDPYFFSEFGREAESSENYGGNNRDMGYANMVDLGDLARNCEYILPQTSQDVQDALEHCVIYQVKGPYRENASGLSCYYSYNGDLEDFEGFLNVGCSDSFKYLYDYALEGCIPPEGMEFLNVDLGYEEDVLPEIPELNTEEDFEYPLDIDDEGYVILELDEDTLNMLKGVYFQLAYLDEENDIMLLLGQDNDIEADWENGVFRDNFRGVWGALDGNLVYMEVYYESDDYTAYAIPILLNGEEYNLRVIYDYNDEEFYILGARKGLEENGMADKNLVQLQPGDEVTTVHYAASISGDDDFEAVPIDTFTVTEDTAFSEVDLGDGEFLMMFEMVDAKNNYVSSQFVQFIVDGEDIEVAILE